MNTKDHPMAGAYDSFVKNAAKIEGELRVQDTVLANVMRRNPRIIRRHIRHHRLDREDSAYGRMLTVRTASGRLSYLLTRLQFHQFIFFESGPRAVELRFDFCNTIGGLMDGTIPSSNAALTIKLQDLAETFAGFGFVRRPSDGGERAP